ncbi:general transcriptional corepressor trfA [Nematostella vectensis]|uniref:general transcriptional corepressor trfA n=1 Tax=Nematostella vectensis TaxID=45351 RepID=UPI002076FE35|nr:general transcriptional corepressor trfA [Nematostella vectensis]
MDLIRSGEIFNIKALQSPRPRQTSIATDISSSDKLNTSLSSSAGFKSDARFQELYLASPRAQELVASMDHTSSRLSESSMRSYKKTTPTKQDPRSAPPSLKNTGLVVNMVDFFKSSNPTVSSNNNNNNNNDTFSECSFSPYKANNERDVLKMQVSDMIDRLATTVGSPPRNHHDMLSNRGPLESADSGFNELPSDSQRNSIADAPKHAPYARLTENSDYCKDSDDDLGDKDSDVDVEDHNSEDNNGNGGTTDTNDGNDAVYDENHNGIAGNDDIDAENHVDEENGVDDGIGKDADDYENQIDKEDEGHIEKEQEGSNDVMHTSSDDTTTQAMALRKDSMKSHSLKNWHLKALKSKSQCGVFVEGQRDEDPIGELWHSTIIRTRVNSRLVQTKSKSKYHLLGPMDEEATLSFGFSQKFVKSFRHGFPNNWEKLVQDHFKPLSSNDDSGKDKLLSKSGGKQRRPVLSMYKTPTRTQGKQIAETTPIEVELRRSRSGRLIKPPMAWWRGQRVVTDGLHNLTTIDPGGEEHTSLSTGLYNYYVRLPEDAPKPLAQQLKCKAFTPKVAKFSVTSPRQKRETLLSRRRSTGESSTQEDSTGDDTSTSATERVRRAVLEAPTSSENSWKPSESEAERIQAISRKRGSAKEASTSSIRTIKGKDQVKKNISFSEDEENTTDSSNDQHPSERGLTGRLRSKQDTGRAGRSTTRNSQGEGEGTRKKTNKIPAHHENDDSGSETVGDVDFLCSPSKTSQRAFRKVTKDAQSRTGSRPYTRATPNACSKELNDSKDGVFDDWKPPLSPKKTRKSPSSTTTKKPPQVNQLQKAKNPLQASKKSPTNKPRPTVTQAKTGKGVAKKTTREISNKQTSSTSWQGEELLRLEDALHSLAPNAPRYWTKVSQLVETRSAEECQLKYQGQLEQRNTRAYNRPERAAKPSAKPKDRKITALCGGVGTLKRKRQLRQLLEQQDDGYEDDIFDSTPFKKSKMNFKFPFAGADIDEDDVDDGEDDGDDYDDEDDRRAEFQTPSNRTPSSRFRPLGPASGGTPSADFISPGLLQHVNRHDVDTYIHRIKQGKRHAPGPQSRQSAKVVKTSTPKKQLKPTSRKSPLVSISDMFEVQHVSDPDSEEGEEDYYWSE